MSLPPMPMRMTDLESRALTASEPLLATILDQVALKYCTCLDNGILLPSFFIHT
jgi:hypothetical protein